MGWKSKAVVSLLGLVFLGAGAWPLCLLCFLFVAVSLRRKSNQKGIESVRFRRGLPGRKLLALGLFGVSGLALMSGGTFSPFVFFVTGMLVLFWPTIGVMLPFGEVVAIENSILLRSRYLPYAWHVVAEMKPGTELLPRAIASIIGRLLVFTNSGRVFVVASCSAVRRRQAEERLLLRLRSSCPSTRTGAYLLPLDGKDAADLLGLKLSNRRTVSAGAQEPALNVPRLLALECQGTRVVRGKAFSIDGDSPSARIPKCDSVIDGRPLLWELLNDVGKVTRWPGPDKLSNLLDSLAATRGVPLGERLSALQTEGSEVTVQTLGGDELSLPRSQLRAVISLYS